MPKKGEKINVSFNISSKDFEIVNKEMYKFKQIKYSEYDFYGKIIYKYSKSDHHSSIIVIDTLDFMFYMEINKKIKASVGKYIKGKGQLLFDYYIWTEFLNNYKKAPDIFHNLIIQKMYEIKIPNKYKKYYISNFSEKQISYPYSLPNDEIIESDIKEIENMTVSTDEAIFYILVLEQITEKIEKTFYNTSSLVQNDKNKRKIVVNEIRTHCT
jgi:hypothetical protein